jgi:hypothetical protein
VTLVFFKKLETIRGPSALWKGDTSRVHGFNIVVPCKVFVVGCQNALNADDCSPDCAATCRCPANRNAGSDLNADMA